MKFENIIFVVVFEYTTWKIIEVFVSESADKYLNILILEYDQISKSSQISQSNNYLEIDFFLKKV